MCTTWALNVSIAVLYDKTVPGKGGVGNAWRLAPAPFHIKFTGERKMNKKEKIDDLLRLLDEFSEEEYEKVLQVLRLALEISPVLSEPRLS